MMNCGTVAFSLLGFLAIAAAHPQCLDFRPPFRPSGKLQTCGEYQRFGCCDTKRDEEIGAELEKLLQQLTDEQKLSCGEDLKTLLCQKCSPYAAHIYDAEDTGRPSTFPGICEPYCKSMMRNCSHIVPLITDETRLVNLASKQNPNSFCKAVLPRDIDYCYPDLVSNSLFYTGLGLPNFYNRRDNPFNNRKRNCLQLCVEEVAKDLRNPLSLKHANDGSNRVFVVEQIGIVWIYDSEWNKLPKPFLNLRDIVLVREYTYDERGMLDILFHPNHGENGLFYLYYTILIRGQHHIKISEMKVSSTDANRANVSSERTLLTVREPAFNHNGGQLLFGIDDYLYIFTGDGGRGGDPFGPVGNAQNKKVLLGKVLRIDVNSNETNPGKPYAIPPDNPFVGNDEYLPEIYALGVRNMWRCSMDRGNASGYNRGRIFCGDVGQSRYEEIDIIEKGGNYGWRAYEGYSCFDRSLCNRRFIENHKRPIHVYPHSVGKSVTGGYVYRGCESPNLNGKYIFGDFTNGKLFSLDQLKNGSWRRRNICMANANICSGRLKNFYAKHILSFGEDQKGEIFMLSTSAPFPGQKQGRVYRLVDPSRRGNPRDCQNSQMAVSQMTSVTETRTTP